MEKTRVFSKASWKKLCGSVLIVHKGHPVLQLYYGKHGGQANGFPSTAFS